MATSFPGGGWRPTASGCAAKCRWIGRLADRLPPQNLEAERVSGQHPARQRGHARSCRSSAGGFLPRRPPGDLAAIRELYDRNKGIDGVTLAEELKLRGQFEQVGGDDTLAEIVGEGPPRGQRQVLRGDVKEKATNRQLIEERHRDHSRRLFQSVPGQERSNRPSARCSASPRTRFGARRSSSRKSSSRRWT